MLHAFVDESYTEDWFFMAAAIVATPRQTVAVEQQFRQLLEDETQRFSMPCPREVHGYELFQGRNDWGLCKLHERLGVAGKVFQVLVNNDVRFIIRGLDRAAQRRRYPTAYEPYPLILTHVMREVDRFARSRNEQAQIICDEIGKHDRHRAMLDRHRERGTPGYGSTTLSAVAGSLEFVESHNSALVQAADIVAYVRHRMASRVAPSREETRSLRRLWRILEPQVVHEFCWIP